MRIEAYSQVQQLYSAQKTAKTVKTEKTREMDRFQLSSVGKDLQVGQAALKETSDIRMELVEPLRQQIKNGTYKVSAESFADKLLEKYNESR
ncbi:MAG: flagellar biosynthesis anti-sigma factor FlgM [Lachnospiraceae bacterium]|jgi:negative regulator of flagellin synthesis FlgM|nr:flagellar biosynthesis anti-sigma factor FlgM [Lachnospiraceae bacterium]MBR4992925.1 flagellar biosynthesis anti-sigma factor FlgM [Lachnospiraceae bacterium]